MLLLRNLIVTYLLMLGICWATVLEYNVLTSGTITCRFVLEKLACVCVEAFYIMEQPSVFLQGLLHFGTAPK